MGFGTIKILATLVLLFPIVALCQQTKVTQDFGSWLGIDIEKKISKNFKISVDQQIRFYTNLSEFDDYLIDLGGNYKINKNFKLAAMIRYTYNAKRFDDVEFNYRYNFDLKFKGALTKKLTLHNRLRYQREHTNIFSSNEPLIFPFSAIRNMVELKYKVNKKHQLLFSTEAFRRFEAFKLPYFSRFRLYLGDEFDTKIGELSLSLGYEQELNNAYPLKFLFLKAMFEIKL